MKCNIKKKQHKNRKNESKLTTLDELLIISIISVTVADDTKKQQLDVNSDVDKKQDNRQISATIVTAAAVTDTNDPVQTALGDFGWWQFWITFALSLLKFPIAWHQLAIIFLAAKTPFRCAEFDDDAVPALFNATDKCGSRDPLTHAVVPCQRFAYDRSIFQETIITEVRVRQTLQPSRLH